MFAKILFVLSLLLLLVPQTVLAHGDNRPMKKGILLVSFGTSVPQAEQAMKNIDSKVKAMFPGVEVRWAYTSKIIRHKLAKESGRLVDSPAQALAKMMEDDFTHVAVQSLHTIPGEEYHGLIETVHAFKNMPKGMKRIVVGYPLLATSKDMDNASKAIMSILPKERKVDEAVILMGHGTHHPADVYYAALQYYMDKKDRNIFVGTVEGVPCLEDIIPTLQQRKIKKVYLLPFMSVAGDHARNDMAGNEEDSWKSKLEKIDMQVVPVLKGTAEYNQFADLWVKHLQKAMKHFK